MYISLNYRHAIYDSRDDFAHNLEIHVLMDMNPKRAARFEWCVYSDLKHSPSDCPHLSGLLELNWSIVLIIQRTLDQLHLP